MDGLYYWELQVMSKEKRKMIWYEDEDFKSELEYFDNAVYVHCTVNNFNKTVVEKIRDEFYSLGEVAHGYGFKHLFAYTQDLKFTNMIHPCEVIGKVEEGGQAYDVIAWEL